MMNCLLFNYNQRLAHNARALGCYRIAHFLRSHGWDVEVIEYAAHWDLPQLQALARSRVTHQTRWIGTSHMFSAWGDVMEEFCVWLRQEYPWIRIISGSSSVPVFESRAIDYYVQGYGEHAVLALLKYLFSNGAAPTFNLLGSGAKKIIPAIDAYPAYPMSSLMVKYQDRDFIVPGEFLGIEFARGCKFQCAYCNFPVLGVKGDYSRNAEDFREQVMDAYDRWGVTGYYVADETFNDRTEKITKFADVVETLPFDPWFSGYIRADLLISRPRDREELVRMGFRGHFYGVESFNRDATKSIGKGMLPHRLKAGLLEVKCYFESQGSGQYVADFGMIIGLPGETLDEVRDSNQWFQQNYHTPHNWHFHVLTIPISEFHKPSKMSQDYQKYGYTALTAKEIQQNQYLSDSNPIFTVAEKKTLSTSGFLLWKNHLTNIFEAIKLEQELYNQERLSTDRGIGIWNITAAVYHDLTLQQRLALTLSDLDLYYKTGTPKSKSIVQDYIQRKLSI